MKGKHQYAIVIQVMHAELSRIFHNTTLNNRAIMRNYWNKIIVIFAFAKLACEQASLRGIGSKEKKPVHRVSQAEGKRTYVLQANLSVYSSRRNLRTTVETPLGKSTHSRNATEESTHTPVELAE